MVAFCYWTAREMRCCHGFKSVASGQSLMSWGVWPWHQEGGMRGRRKRLRQKEKAYGWCLLALLALWTSRVKSYQPCPYLGQRNGSTACSGLPLFWKNIIVTCEIVSFLWSWDHFLLKNVIVFIFGKQILKWGSFEKAAIFDLLFTFFSHQRKDTKNPLAHF